MLGHIVFQQRFLFVIGVVVVVVFVFTATFLLLITTATIAQWHTRTHNSTASETLKVFVFLLNLQQGRRQKGISKSFWEGLPHQKIAIESNPYVLKYSAWAHVYLFRNLQERRRQKVMLKSFWGGVPYLKICPYSSHKKELSSDILYFHDFQLHFPKELLEISYSNFLVDTILSDRKCSMQIHVFQTVQVLQRCINVQQGYIQSPHNSTSCYLALELL